MYPAWDTWQHVIIEACWKVVWRKAGKTLPGPATGCQFSLSWINTTTPWSLKLKSNDFQTYPRGETAASGGRKNNNNNADNIRKVLCKSFIQRFWELNLCSYKHQVDCFDSLRLSVFFCCCWSTLKWKSRNITLNVKLSQETSGLLGKQN